MTLLFGGIKKVGEHGKITVRIPKRYCAQGDFCRRLKDIVEETAGKMEIVYLPDAAAQLQIGYPSVQDRCFSEEIIVTLERFAQYCQQADILPLLRELCKEQNVLEDSKAVLSALEAWLAEECIQLWYANILPEVREQASKHLRQHFDAKCLLTAMAKRYWDTPEELVRKFGKIEISGQKKEVQTIAIFNYQMWTGGTERVISILAPMYEEMGYRVVVITIEGPSAEDFPLSPHIPHRQITGTWETYSGNLDARLDQWDALIKEYAIDIVVYHPWTLHLLAWDALFLRLRGVSVVFQTHSIFSFMLAEGKSEFSLLTDRLTLGNGLVVTCRADKTFWNCFLENVHHIPNPVAPALKQARRTSGGQKKIVWIGRFAPEKRPMDAICIMEYVVRWSPDAVLYMIGGGNEAIQEQCRQAVLEKGLEHNVEFLGFQKNVYQYLESASVHVVTSVYEGYSMVLLEAMAHGVPTVMYEMPYLDLYRADYGVLGVEESNYKQAAAKICHLLRDPAAWKQASQAAVEGFAETAGYDYRGAWKRLILGEISPSVSTEEEKTMMRAIVEHYLIGWRRNHAELSAKNELPVQDGIQPKAPPDTADEKETACMWLKRKIRGGIRCVRENGVRYTLRRIKEKFLAKFGKEIK